MGIWEQFPFTNFHEQNLDWAYKSIKDLNERVEEIEAGGGGATKDYVDAQDEKLSAEIIRVESECDENTTNISRDLNTEVENRQTADNMIDNSINAVKTDVTSIKQRIGEWTQPVTMSNAISTVQETAGKSATAIHGTDGTYDLSKGTIQERLNDLENGEGLNVEKSTVNTLDYIAGTTLSLPSFQIEAGKMYMHMPEFEINSSNKTLSDAFIFIRNWNNTQGSSPVILLPAIYETSTNYVRGFVCAFNPTSAPISVPRQTVTLEAYKSNGHTFVTNVSGNIINGGTSDVTKSYVDSQDAALDAKITTAQETANSAVTMATEARDKAENASTVANNAKTEAYNAKTAADNARTAADGATETAQTANDNATTALMAIGSKSTAVTFSNLWSAIGAWNESATITARLKDAYNWALNSRSAINGSTNYPADKASINQRLNTLEEAKPSASAKVASGSGLLKVATGQELVVDYSAAGFTAIPVVVASYYKEGENDTSISGIVKVWEVTKTGCKISVTGGDVGHNYSVGWIATGK